MKKRYRIMARVPKGQGDMPEIVAVKSAPNQVYFCNDPNSEWYQDNVPCRRACPADTRIPEYIDAAARGDYDLSYEINLMDNVLPHALGRVCAHPCERACRHGFEGMGEPVSICWLKRSGADYKATSPALKPAPATGKKIAVIGGGPAGLVLAFDFTLWGHKVTIYEGHDKAGGMLRYGIPRFRLPESVMNEEIDRIVAMGVTLRTNRWVGKDPLMEELQRDFDAIVIAAGASEPNQLNIPGRNAAGVVTGLEFMELVNAEKMGLVKGHVVVLGGGYTAMDCSRSALRMGASKVTVVYRRSRNEFKVDERELRETALEGISFQYLLSPVEIKTGTDGRVSQIVFSRMRLSEPGRDGRRNVVPVANAFVAFNCDMVVAAISQSPDTSFFSPDYKGVGKDFATNIPKVWATGDFTTGPRDIISAIGDARRASRAIDRALMGRDRHEIKVTTSSYKQSFLGSFKGWKSIGGNIYDLIPRKDMDTLDFTARKAQTEEVDLGYGKEDTYWQGERCYLCNHNVQIDEKACILCYNCVDVCPYECILMLQEQYVRVARSGGEPAAENKGHTYMVMDEEKCVRCGLCIDVCPVPCMEMEKYTVERTFTP